MPLSQNNGMPDGVYIIAEAGVNHNGSLETALELVNIAADSGANAVKFQTFRAQALATSSAPKAAYQERQTGSNQSQLEMLKALVLEPGDYLVLFKRCQDLDIEFLSTAFDEESLFFLIDKIGIKRLKAPSGELTNGPLLLRMSQTGLPVIVSTGMASLDEIKDALAVLAFGYLGKDDPTSSNFMKAFQSNEGQRELSDKVTLLHCTTEYPAPIEDVNLRAMSTLRNQFNLPVGYSDHTLGLTIPVAAVAMGATIIEKHFTLDRTMAGPDHSASLEPDEFKEMVSRIKATELAIGDGIKKPAPSEINNRTIARRSLVALCAIKKGDIFSAENVGARRPNDGISPMKFWDILGMPATQDYAPEEAIIE